MRDDFCSVVADRFKVLDHVPVPDTWSRVQLKVLDHMPGPETWSPVQFTEEEVVTMIDLDTPVPTGNRRKRPMRVLVAAILAAAAAAAVAIVVVATRDGDPVKPADEPSTTVTLTRFPRALNNTGFGVRYFPGTYFVDVVTGTPTARIHFTIGAGWRDMSPGLEILQGDIGGIAFSRAEWVFSDACHWIDGYYQGPIETVDGLVAALSEQGGWVDVTAPSDISVDGYAGKTFQRTAPAELSDCTTIQANFSPWGGKPTDPEVPLLRSWHNDRWQLSGGDFYEPGEVETLWVLDIDGTVVVINTRLWPSVTTGARLTPEATALAGPSAEARADSAAVLDSIRIDRG